MHLPAPRSTNNAEWDDAWDMVRSLHAPRASLSADADHRGQDDSPVRALLEVENHHTVPSVTAAPATAPDDDELIRALADIEKAAAALRRAEPALEVGLERARPISQTANTRPLLTLIGLLWISTVLVTTGVILALASLVV
jgi:hypothetical protein